MTRKIRAILASVAVVSVINMVGDRGTTLRAQPPKGKETAEQTQADLSETVGLLSGLHLYQTYLNIGMLADCKAEGIYPERDAMLLLASVMSPLEKIDKQLEKIVKRISDKNDREALDRVRRLIGLLQEEGKQLQLFWETGKAEHSTKYEAARKEAWEGVSKLLGIQEP